MELHTVCRNNREQPLTKLSVIKRSRREITTMSYETLHFRTSGVSSWFRQDASVSLSSHISCSGCRVFAETWSSNTARISPESGKEIRCSVTLHVIAKRGFNIQLLGNLRRGELKARFCAELDTRTSN